MSVQPWLGLTELLPSVGREAELGQCTREHLQHPALMRAPPLPCSCGRELEKANPHRLLLHFFAVVFWGCSGSVPALLLLPACLHPLTGLLIFSGHKELKSSPQWLFGTRVCSTKREGWDLSLHAIQACAGAPLQQTRSRVQRTQTAGTLGSATAGKSQRKPSCTFVLGATLPCPPCPACSGKEVAFLHGRTGWGAGAGAPHGTAAKVAGTSAEEQRAAFRKLKGFPKGVD